MTSANYLPYTDYQEYTIDEMKKRSEFFYTEMKRRRTVRSFSDRPVPRSIIENCLMTAGSAPSGANRQPWHFAVVSDPAIKRQIKEAAEKEEYGFYHGRAPQEWRDALSHLGTDEHKPFLEIAPYLIVIFAQSYGLSPEGEKIKHYYVNESVGISTGLLIAAIHNAGLVSLTHTPSPMNFLSKILNRPPNERAYLILVVGYPAETTAVPDIRKKTIEEIAGFI
jgi:nitroreductase